MPLSADRIKELAAHFQRGRAAVPVTSRITVSRDKARDKQAADIAHAIMAQRRMKQANQTPVRSRG